MANYYSKYSGIVSKAKAASECCQTNSVSKLKDEVDVILSSIKNISYSWDDIAYNGFIESEEKTIISLQKVDEQLDSYLYVEKVYIALNNDLNELKQTENTSNLVNSNMPSPTDYGLKKDVSLQSLDLNNKAAVEYKKALEEWQVTNDKLTNYATTLDQRITSYINYLNAVNNNPEEIASLRRPVLSDANNNYQTIVNDINKDFLGQGDGILTGEALIEFKKKNKIPLDTKITIKKSIVKVNNVDMPIYKIYDDSYSNKKHDQFDKYVADCLKYEAKIDEAVLKKVVNNGTSILFMESYRCDNDSYKKGKWEGLAFYHPGTKNIRLYFCDHDLKSEWYTKYNQSSIVHETGHAYDTALMDELGGVSADNQWSISELTEKQITNGYKTWWKQDVSSAAISKNFTTDQKGTVYTWSDLANKEADAFDKSVTFLIDHQSGYDANKYKKWPSEYFADSFQAYYLGDKKKNGISKFQYYAPETYKAINQLISNEKKNYARI